MGRSIELARTRWSPHVILASLTVNLLGLALPLILIQVYDRVIPNGNLQTLAALAAGLMIACAIDLAVRSARGQLVSCAGSRFERQTYSRALDKILGTGSAGGREASPGEVLDQLASIERIRQHHCGEAVSAVLDVPFIAIFIALLAFISPAIGAAVAVIAALSVLVLTFLRRPTLKLWAGRQDRDRRRYSFLAETLGGIEMIRGLAIEPLIERRYERLMAGGALTTAELSARVQFLQGVASTISIAAPIAISGIGSFLVITQEMSVGGLAAAVLLTSRVIQPVLRIEALIAGEQDVRHSELELSASLRSSERIPGSESLNAIETVTLKDVAWAPSLEAPNLLRDASFQLKRGDCVLLSGSDGSGRSTVLSLIIGHLVPSRGAVLLNGRAREEYNPSTLCERVRLLSPDFGVLDGTLLENMTAFQPERYREKALLLARELGLDQFMARHTEGLGMRVAPHSASTLPKSVQDAVVLVSCLVSDPDVILFDEANIGLDHQFDARLLSLLRRRSPDIIIVMVSNRPSYKALANRQLLVRDGVVEEIVAPSAQVLTTESLAS